MFLTLRGKICGRCFLLGLLSALLLLQNFFPRSLALAKVPAAAQDGSPSTQLEKDDMIASSIEDAAIVGGSGFAGAVIGLSTLSFMSEPKEHLNHIVVGAALGVISGVFIVTWRQATRSQDIYERAPYAKNEHWESEVKLKNFNRYEERLTPNNQKYGFNFYKAPF